MTRLPYNIRPFYTIFSLMNFLFKYIAKEEAALASSVTRPSRPTWDYVTRQPKSTKKFLPAPKTKNSAAGK